MVRLFAGLLAVVLIASAAPSRAQNLDPLTRSKIDADLHKADRVGELLHIAHRYATSGYKQEAKAVVTVRHRRRGQVRSGKPWPARISGSATRRMRQPRSGRHARQEGNAKLLQFW
jgi:hypothetical protein